MTLIVDKEVFLTRLLLTALLSEDAETFSESTYIVLMSFATESSKIFRIAQKSSKSINTEFWTPSQLVS